MQVFWSTSEWARAIAELPADGPLPVRTVLVPRERVAHALRRELIRMGHSEVLSGTRFVPLFVAAAEVLLAAGVPFVGREERLRPLRLRILLQQRLALRHFNPERLRETPGWDEAFARAIEDLEDAALQPADLAGLGPALQDVAALWRELDAWAPRSWTTGRVFTEAARALEQRASLWPFEGPVLAALSADSSPAQARFATAIAGARVDILPGRPLRSHYVRRVQSLFGDEAAALLASERRRGEHATERDILASYLFEAPDVLAEPARPRSRGRDGTVQLEEHAGLEEEIESAVDWVARQVLESRTALEDVALLTPQLDPLATLIVERLRRLPWPDGVLPVFVAGGLPLVGEAAGARVLAVIRALRAGLSAERLADVLPSLRTSDEEHPHLSRGAAQDLAFSLGTAGGSPTNPRGALEWSACVARREQDIAQWLDRARAAQDLEEQAGAARQSSDLERLLRDLRAIRPAVDRLVAVARHVLDGEPLADLWAELRAFLDGWLLAAGAGPAPWVLLAEALEPVCADDRFAELSGNAALAVIEQVLGGLRVPVGRFGEPSVYVGTIRDAVGIPFTAVRMLHLAEGAIPPSVVENPVLAEPLRARLAGGLVASAADRALFDLQALDRIVRDTRGTVVFSAPRFGVERTDREPSSVFIEAAAALGRPNRLTGERDRLVPNSTALQRDSFAPARADAEEFRAATPITASAWLARAAGNGRSLPAAWQGSPALDLARVAALLHPSLPGSHDGLLGEAGTGWQPAGLIPERPISASALRGLLECPHRFLFERVLSWREPVTPPSRRMIDGLAYGGLLHRVAEAFFRDHGEDFGERSRTLDEWQAIGARAADRQFDVFCREYPLVGATVREQQRQRLRRDFRSLLDYDWNGGRKRRFVAVEKAFGVEQPLELTLDGVRLFLRGFIDRVDVENGRTLVRDLKTGRARPRLGKDAEANPRDDVQIAVYGMAAERLAKEWGAPELVVAAYMYTDARGDPERSFRDDFAELRAAAAGWLDVAARLLNERAFPRTPRDDDCKYCPFRPVCGPDGRPRSAMFLAAADGTLALFHGLKAGVAGEEEE